MSEIQENKNYVTSYAFGVDDALLGKALASPTRRLCSIGFDSLIIASLTLMSATVMAVCVFFVSLVGIFKIKKQEPSEGVNTLATNALKVAAVLSGVIVVTSLLVGDIKLDLNPFDSAQISVSTEPTNTPEKAESKEASGDKPVAADRDASDPEVDLSIVDWAQAALSDLGLSFGWAALYFSVFTAWFGGQTIGKALFRIKVLKVDGSELNLWESFGRYGGYSAGVATGLLGFLQIVWDPNRQAIHDKISETVVVDLRKPNRIV